MDFCGRTQKKSPDGAEEKWFCSEYKKLLHFFIEYQYQTVIISRNFNMHVQSTENINMLLGVMTYTFATSFNEHLSIQSNTKLRTTKM